MLVAALFTIADVWTMLRCPPTCDWKKKTCVTPIYSVEFYSALLRTEPCHLSGMREIGDHYVKVRLRKTNAACVFSYDVEVERCL